MVFGLRGQGRKDFGQINREAELAVPDPIPESSPAVAWKKFRYIAPPRPRWGSDSYAAIAIIASRSLDGTVGREAIICADRSFGFRLSFTHRHRYEATPALASQSRLKSEGPQDASRHQPVDNGVRLCVVAAVVFHFKTLAQVEKKHVKAKQALLRLRGRNISVYAL